MSVLFTAVSVEQQEIVAGGGDEATVANVAILEVKGKKNEVKVSQTARLINLRNSRLARVTI